MLGFNTQRSIITGDFAQRIQSEVKNRIERKQTQSDLTAVERRNRLSKLYILHREK